MNKDRTKERTTVHNCEIRSLHSRFIKFAIAVLLSLACVRRPKKNHKKRRRSGTKRTAFGLEESRLQGDVTQSERAERKLLKVYVCSSKRLCTRDVTENRARLSWKAGQTPSTQGCPVPTERTNDSPNIYMTIGSKHSEELKAVADFN